MLKPASRSEFDLLTAIIAAGWADYNLGDIDVSAVRDLSGLFDLCRVNRNLSDCQLPRCDHDVLSARFDFDGLASWDVSQVTDMRRMFAGCKTLTGSSLGDWDVSSVTDMSEMFTGCTEFIGETAHGFSLALYRWDVSHVRNMKEMFMGCEAGNSGSKSGRTGCLPAAQKWSGWFSWLGLRSCSRAERAWRCGPLSPHFPPENCRRQRQAPNRLILAVRCKTAVPACRGSWPGFSADRPAGPAVPQVSGLLREDPAGAGERAGSHSGGSSYFGKRSEKMRLKPKNRTELDRLIAEIAHGGVRFNLEDIDIGAVDDLSRLFDMQKFPEFVPAGTDPEVMARIKQLWDRDELPGDFDLSAFADEPLYVLSAEKRFDFAGLAGWDVSHVTSMRRMFSECRLFNAAPLAGWDVSQVTDMREMFSGCLSLTPEVRVADIFAGCDLSAHTDMRCLNLTPDARAGLMFSGWDVSEVTDMEGMFADCGSIDAVSLALWNVSQVTNMRRMFGGTSFYAGVDAGSADASAAEDFLAGWNVGAVSSMDHMFSRSHSFTGETLVGWDVSGVTCMCGMFSGCGSFTGKGLESWDVSGVRNMQSMFADCASFSGESLRKWQVSPAANVRWMFSGCKKLEPGNLPDGLRQGLG